MMMATTSYPCIEQKSVSSLPHQTNPNIKNYALCLKDSTIITTLHSNERYFKKEKTVVKAVCCSQAQLPMREEEDEQVRDGAGAGPQGDNLNRLRPGQHWPEPIPNTGQKRALPQRACRVCSEKMHKAGATQQQLKNERKRTSIQCEQCKTPLCIHPCFKAYHTKVNYWQ